MQVSANVAVKNATQTSSSSVGSPSIQPNGSNNSEPVSFAEFEQKLDQSAVSEEEHAEVAENGDQPLQSAESSQQPSQPQSQQLSAEALRLQGGTPESAAMSLAQQNALAGSAAALPVSSSAATVTPQLQGLQAGNPLSGLEAGQQEQLLAQLAGQVTGQQAGQSKGQDAVQQMNQFLARLTGQAAQTDPANAELLEQVQQLVKQQKAVAGDALPLAKEMMIPVDGGTLMDKLAATSLSVPAMNMHSNISSQINSGTNMTMPSSSATTSATQQFHASVDVTEPEWGRDLVEQLRSRMQLSKTDQIQQAHVRLDPPELGRLEVNLRLEGDKVSVHFTAAHPQLREALAANAERLRFDLDGSQMQLADVSVSSGQYQQSHQQSGAEDETGIMANQVMMQPEDTSATALSGLEGRYEAMV
ncbi:flagellar hook-length control protein FliK [Photobacterium sp. SDRW27]|uniref:flagellar hook-length control protein FliK n=1 Tax=Photobacterium obscurum TaxID=2829490 RepID=UPI002243262E|nr:flagellar hook-length control protein FliK [Photobacterium obscurum]MCW8330682.1 flagellar hook-length control protein FliK [Photobacterium obscurum]